MVSDSVAAEPALEESIVMTLPLVPVATNDVTVVVTPAGSVTVFGGLIVNVVHVFAPVKITAPDPPPVIVRALNVRPPPAKVFEVAEVSEITMFEVPLVKVRFVVVEVSHTVPVPDSVHVPFPSCKVRVFEFEDANCAAVTANVAPLNVPCVNVKILDTDNASVIAMLVAAVLLIVRL